MLSVLQILELLLMISDLILLKLNLRLKTTTMNGELTIEMAEMKYTEKRSLLILLTSYIDSENGMTSPLMLLLWNILRSISSQELSLINHSNSNHRPKLVMTVKSMSSNTITPETNTTTTKFTTTLMASKNSSSCTTNKVLTTCPWLQAEVSIPS